jgi:hypothetical protein
VTPQAPPGQAKTWLRFRHAPHGYAAAQSLPSYRKRTENLRAAEQWAFEYLRREEATIEIDLASMRMATPAGIEPATNSLEGCCSIQLSYGAVQKRDGFSSNRHPALGYFWSMMFSENRYPLFGIML